jgi:type VI secretion system protein ImpM
VSGVPIAVQGFFGKIPSHGDFVTRNLSREFIDPWDEWLQGSLAQSKTRLGDRWLDVYLTSPIWRFALTPGVCGRGAWAGLMMPSVDRVGRYFPLTIATSLPERGQPFQAAAYGDAWFRATEALALRALDDDAFDAAALQSALDAVTAIDLRALAQEALAHEALVTTADDWSLAMPGLVGPDLPVAVADRLVAHRTGSYSLWWTIGSDEIRPSALVVGGLPNPGSFAELMSATWGAAEDDNTDSGRRGSLSDLVGP